MRVTPAPRIVIIGAGLIGLSAADSLLSRGCDVTVIEARSGPVRGTSFANSGMIHPSQARPWSHAQSHRGFDQAVSDVRDLAEISRELILARANELRLTESTERPRGCYQIFDTGPDAAAAQKAYGQDCITANRVDAALVLGRAASGHTALYFPQDRSADSRLYGQALARELGARGAMMIYDAATLSLSRSGDGRAQAAMGDHIFPADHIILAAGAQTPEILSSLGYHAPIRPVRGWSVDFAWPNQDIQEVLPRIPVMDAPSRSTFTPFSDRFRLSGTLEESSAAPLLARWAQLMPQLMGAVDKPLSVWSGLRPVCDLGRPMIGKTPIAGLWINAGHGHLGWTLCAGSGELLADMIIDGRADARFAPEISLERNSGAATAR